MPAEPLILREGVDSMNEKIHPDTEIGLVGLRIADLDRSLRFYEDVVGLKQLSRGDGVAELTADGVRPLVRLRQIPGAAAMPRRGQAGLYHFAILVPDRKSLGLSLRNLIEHRIQVGQSDHLVSEALYISDPDGNGIEIYRDRPRSKWTYDAAGQVRMAVDPIDWDGLLAEAGNSAWTGLPAGTTIGHIHLHVSDLGDSRSFYEKVLGLDVMAAMGNAALFVAAGGYHHHIGLNVWAGVGAKLAPENAAGLSFYELVVPDETAIRAVRDRLAAAGAAIGEEGGFPVFRDPTGIEIRLRTPR